MPSGALCTTAPAVAERRDNTHVLDCRSSLFVPGGTFVFTVTTRGKKYHRKVTERKKPTGNQRRQKQGREIRTTGGESKNVASPGNENCKT